MHHVYISLTNKENGSKLWVDNLMEISLILCPPIHLSNCVYREGASLEKLQ